MTKLKLVATDGYTLEIEGEIDEELISMIDEFLYKNNIKHVKTERSI